MRKVCAIVWTYSGPADKADEVFAPIKAFGNPLLYGVQPLPLPAWQAAFDGLYPKGAQMYWRAEFLDEMSDEAIAAQVRHGAVPTVQSTSHITRSTVPSIAWERATPPGVSETSASRRWFLAETAIWPTRT